MAQHLKNVKAIMSSRLGNTRHSGRTVDTFVASVRRFPEAAVLLNPIFEKSPELPVVFWESAAFNSGLSMAVKANQSRYIAGLKSMTLISKPWYLPGKVKIF